MDPATHTIRLRKFGVTFFADAKATCTMRNCTPDWYAQWWHTKFRSWEPSTFRIFRTFLRNNHTYMDVGSWIGPTVLFGAALAKRVVALEPDPEAHRVLLQNIAANPQYGNIVTVQAALSDHVGTTLFGGNGDLGNSESTILVNDPGYIASQGSTSRTGDAVRDAEWRAGQCTTVATTTIDVLDQELQLMDVNFMKIDIEGGEKIVIPAIEQFLKLHTPTLYISLHWMYLTEVEMTGIVAILCSIYPVLYDESLLRRVDRETILSEKLTSVVCTMRPLSFLQRVSIALSMSIETLDRLLRRSARRVISLIR